MRYVVEGECYGCVGTDSADMMQIEMAGLPIPDRI